MMNYLWGGMLVIGIVYGAITGNMHAVTDGVLTSAKEAVTLSLAMLGIVAFWSGLMEVAVEAGNLELCKIHAIPFRFLANLHCELPEQRLVISRVYSYL